jgi:hypothetical protein
MLMASSSGKVMVCRVATVLRTVQICGKVDKVKGVRH